MDQRTTCSRLRFASAGFGLGLSPASGSLLRRLTTGIGVGAL